MKYLLISLLIITIIILFTRKIEGYYGPLYNIHYPGNDIGYFENSTAVNCMGFCESHPDCVGLTHSGTNCWIKNTNAFYTANLTPATGVNTYFK